MFTVTKIIDRRTIEVTPNWQIGVSKGNLVKIKEFLNVEREFNEFEVDWILNKMSQLLLNKRIELKNPVNDGHPDLKCSVYLNDNNIDLYFPENKPKFYKENFAAGLLKKIKKLFNKN